MERSSITIGEWALLSAHFPGQLSQPIGILLNDTTDELHVKIGSDWSRIVSDQAETEVWRELAQDLEERGREFGASSTLDWLENTASHVIQIGAREAIDVSNVESTLEALYQQHVQGSSHEDYSAIHRRGERHFVHVAMAAGLFGAAILVATLTHTKALRSSKITGILYSSEVLSFPPESPYRIPRFDSMPEFLPRVHFHRARVRHKSPHPHRRLQIDALVFKPLTYRSVEVDAPPPYDLAETNPTAPVYFELPEPPSFRRRRNRFVQFLSLVASPFKKLFLTPRDVGETVLN